jgi:predicted enzyme related to lactoylglutathione lyase
MEQVTGIGGFFFRARDPSALAAWYEANLGVTMAPQSYDAEVWRTEGGVTVFAPFDLSTDYLGDWRAQWMINFRVRDLAAMVAQLRAAGIDVAIDPEEYPNGRFAKLRDPGGNGIQLWEPAGPARG